MNGLRSKHIYLLLITIFSFLSFSSFAKSIRLIDTRFAANDEQARLVFELSGQPTYNVFNLSKPERLVIDIKTLSKGMSLKDFITRNKFINNVRSGRRGTKLRIVIDLKQKINHQVFILKETKETPTRLVVDLMSKKTKRPTKRKVKRSVPRQVVIVIDAGHGGKDPGATGPTGVHEKNIVLKIAKTLSRMIDREPGMKAVLTRRGDYYISLRQRLRVARKQKADVFVSIHADAFKDKTSIGASVFALSSRGASSEAARWIAERENRSELLGGVDLQGKSDTLRSVLLDLSQTATISASLQLGEAVLGALKRLTRLHYHRVEQAGFVVLKSPDIPSILVETGFITNPYEEEKLQNARYQKRIATALINGIREYFHRKPPPGSALSIQPTRYTAMRGDTLTSIATKFKISVNQLKKYNQFRSSQHLRKGQIITIPPG